jgi:AcrR family transcriptional regulator
MANMKSEEKRVYRMGRRGEQVREAGERILATVRKDFLSRYLDEVTLDEVAAATGVTVQTLLRRYGSKEGLFTAANELLNQDFHASRDRVEAGDIDMAVRMIVRGYERNGDTVVRALFQEERVTAVRSAVEYGRRHHHAWVARVFAPWLESRATRERSRLRGQLIAVLDVFTWKLLRRDLGLSASETEAAMRELLEGLLAPISRPARKSTARTKEKSS